MTLFALAYLGGVFTIAAPCIFPILPLVLARTDVPFRRGILPMLLGLIIAFASVASLGSVAGSWAVEANKYGRNIALILIVLFGLTMVAPALAVWLTMPVVSIGSRLSRWSWQRERSGGATTSSSLLLGVATGLVWAPCAGPVLGLILTGAALRGPSLETSLLLLTYALGAATSLATGLFFGRQIIAAFKHSMSWGDGLRRILGIAVIAGAATIWLGLDTALLTRWSSVGTTAFEQGLITTWRNRPIFVMDAARDKSLSGVLASVVAAPQWLNTRPLQSEDIRGKVVLVNFWTYSCINCLRVLPYTRAWADKYRDRGLVVVGVHTPEFAFEKDIASVRKAVGALGVGYPVAIDNDFAIWRAFGNDSWPALYFMGRDGEVRHAVVGERDYEQSERLIQQLLSEGSAVAPTDSMAAAHGTGPQAPADNVNSGSPETYVGYGLGRTFVSPGGVRKDVPTLYQTPSILRPNRWSMTGVWTIGREYATLNDSAGAIAYRFHSRDLHLVLAPSSQGHSIRFRVTIDGNPPGDNHGFDVNADGWGSVQDGRLYQLIRQSGAIKDRTFQIEFFDAGVQAYAFTFG